MSSITPVCFNFFMITSFFIFVIVFLPFILLTNVRIISKVGNKNRNYGKKNIEQ